MLHTIWLWLTQAAVMKDAGRLLAANEYRAHGIALAGAKAERGKAGPGHWSRVAIEIRRRRSPLKALWSRCL